MSHVFVKDRLVEAFFPFLWIHNYFITHKYRKIIPEYYGAIIRILLVFLHSAFSRESGISSRRYLRLSYVMLSYVDAET